MYSCGTFIILFERSEFLIATSKKKKSVRVCGCSTNLGFSVENTNLGVSVGYVLCASYVCTWYQPADHSMVPGTYVQYRATSQKKKNTWYQRALRCQFRGRPFHPWAGRPRFSGEAHPGPATLTQSCSFSCGASLHRRLHLASQLYGSCSADTQPQQQSV